MSTVEEKEAKHGEKMIVVEVRFFTNNLASGKGKINPKHAWTQGMVRIEKNEPHGIKPKSGAPFNSLMQIGAAVEKCLIEHGIILHIKKNKMGRYIKE